MLEDGERAGYFCLDFGGEPAYQELEGHWLSAGPYGTIHRVVVADGHLGRGLAKQLFALAEAACRRRGIGRALVEGVFARLAPGETLWVGTAEGVPWGLAFYGACGFVRDHLVPGFFLKNYPQPVMDGGIRCIDMVYLRRKKEES